MIITMKGIQGDPNEEKKDEKKVLDEVPNSKEDLLKMINKSKKKRGDEKLWFFSNTEVMATRLMELGHKPIQEITVQGISGGIIAESSYNDIPVCCLFSPLNELYKFVSVDARAAVAVLKCKNLQ
jgi:predicted ATP-grasp superfamily ATP-dependent carboligase